MLEVEPTGVSWSMAGAAVQCSGLCVGLLAAAESAN